MSQAPPLEEETSRGQRSGPLAALREPNFQLLLFGNGLSQAGDQMEVVARGWLVLTLTDSPIALGLVAFAAGLPRLLLALVAGVLADRFDRRTLLLGSTVASLVISSAYAALVLIERIDIWGVVAIVLALSVFSTLNIVLRQAIVPDVVARREVAGAVALNQSVRNTTQVVAQSVAGVLVGWFGVAGVLFLNAASFLFLLGSLMRMRLEPAPMSTERLGFREDLVGGVRYVWSSRETALLLMLALLPFLFIQPYRTMLPIFARDILAVGPGGYGVLMASPGAGGLIAATLIGAAGLKRRVPLMLICLLVASVALAGFALVPSFPLAVLALVVVGGAFNGFRVLNVTVLQLITPRAMMGRVLGLVNMDRGFLPLGSLLVGLLANLMGAPLAVAVPAVACVALTVWVAVTRPSLRRL